MTEMLPGLDIDTACPRCGYNLRALTEMRCPKCGRPFEWLDVLVPASRVQPYLFEHDGQGFRAFWRTAWGGLWPRTFWPPLHPAQPSRPRRMLAYWAVAMAVAFLGVLGPHLAIWVGSVHESNLDPGRRNEILLARALAGSEPGHAVARFDPPARYLDARGFLRLARETEPSFLAWWAWGCAWPWLTWAALMLLRRLSPRSEWMTSFVTPTSLLRCALYSADVLLWAGLGLLALAALGLAARLAELSDPFPHWLPAASAIAVTGAAALRCVHKLGVGLEAYLRVSRPWRWVIVSQAMVIAAGLLFVGAGRLALRWLG